MAQRSQDPLKGWAVHTATEWRLSHKLMSAHSKHAKSHCCTYSNENKTLRNWQACTTTKEMCTVCEAVLDVEQKHDFYPIHAWIRWFLLHISDLPQLCCVIVISLVILGGIPTYPLFIICLLDPADAMPLVVCCVTFTVTGLSQLLWLQAQLHCEPALVFRKVAKKLLLLQLAK